MLGVPRRAGARGPRRRDRACRARASPRAGSAPRRSALYDVGVRRRSGGCTTPSASLETIVRRYLRTHALIGLDDLTARYPIDPARRPSCSNAGPRTGGLVRLDPVDGDDGPRWADGGTWPRCGGSRSPCDGARAWRSRPRSSPTSSLRRQHVHPRPAREGAAAVGLVLEQLQGFAAPAELWEAEILPAPGARLPTRLARRGPRARAAGSGGPTRTAGASRGSPSSRAISRRLARARGHRTPLGRTATLVLDHARTPGRQLRDRPGPRLGARAVADVARRSRAARRGLVTNDRFDPLRPGAEAVAEALAEASASARPRRPGSADCGSRRGRPRPGPRAAGRGSPAEPTPIPRRRCWPGRPRCSTVTAS